MSDSNRRRRKLWQGDQLSFVVKGAIESAINDHGPITKENIGSAVKRVVSQVRNYGFDKLVTPTQHARDWERRYEQLKHGHEILLERHERLRTRLAELEAPPAGESAAWGGDTPIFIPLWMSTPPTISAESETFGNDVTVSDHSRRLGAESS